MYGSGYDKERRGSKPQLRLRLGSFPNLLHNKGKKYHAIQAKKRRAYSVQVLCENGYILLLFLNNQMLGFGAKELYFNVMIFVYYQLKFDATVVSR